MTLTRDAGEEDRSTTVRVLTDRTHGTNGPKGADGPNRVEGIPTRGRPVAVVLVTVLILVTFSCLLLGAGQGWLDQRSGADNGVVGGSLLAGFVLQAIGIIVGVAGLGWALYHRVFSTAVRSSIRPADLGASTPEDPWMLGMIRSGVPLPDRLGRRFAIAVASKHRHIILGISPLVAGMTLTNLGAGITSEHPFVLGLALVTTLLVCVAWVSIAADYRRAGVFLQRGGDPAPASK